MKFFAGFFTVLLVSLWTGCTKYKAVQSYELGDGYRCELFEARQWEVHVPYFYTIKHDRELVVPYTYIAGFLPKSAPEFRMRQSKDGRLTVLSTARKPNAVIMLFEKDHRLTWPRAGEKEMPTDVELRGLRLLNTARDALGEPELILDRDR